MNAAVPIVLKPEQRLECRRILEMKRAAPDLRQRALILLLADQRLGERAPGNEMIAWWADVDRRTVTRVRSSFHCEGFTKALHGQMPAPLVSRELSHDQELRLLSLLDTAPPPGSPRWTVRTLADAASYLDGMPEISRELVRRLLKRHLPDFERDGAGRALPESAGA